MLTCNCGSADIEVISVIKGDSGVIERYRCRSCNQRGKMVYDFDQPVKSGAMFNQ